MPKLIRDGAIVADEWVVVRLAEDQAAASYAIPAGRVIVPLVVWQEQRAALLARVAKHGNVGVWIASHERPEALRDDVAHLPVIAVDFPKFADGRGYSIAYNLRERLGYAGELRAIGDVLRDQLFYMSRVGFNAFAVRADRDIHDALKGLTDFSEPYQASWDIKSPLFRRVRRTGKAQGTDA